LCGLLAPRAGRLARGRPVGDGPAGAGSLFFRPGSEARRSSCFGWWRTARADGLDPKRYRSRDLPRLVRAAQGGNPQAIARADRALASCSCAMRRTSAARPTSASSMSMQRASPAGAERRRAARIRRRCPDLGAYMRDMGWMHPYYAQLRRQLTDARLDPATALAGDELNMARVRSLPASGRYVMVNVAAQRLFMIENNQTVDMMRVVVGKPVYPTPMMAAYIRYTSLRPYWNVPSDLAAERIVPNVIKGGVPYLRQKGYQVLSDWSDKAKVISPASVDWQAVAAGRKEVRLRQLPGPPTAWAT
jgi:hypothetical protein